MVEDCSMFFAYAFASQSSALWLSDSSWNVPVVSPSWVTWLTNSWFVIHETANSRRLKIKHQLQPSLDEPSLSDFQMVRYKLKSNEVLKSWVSACNYDRFVWPGCKYRYGSGATAFPTEYHQTFELSSHSYHLIDYHISAMSDMNDVLQAKSSLPILIVISLLIFFSLYIYIYIYIY